MYGVLTGESAAGSKAPDIKVHGLPAVVRAVATAGGFANVTVSVNGGAAAPVPIASLAALIDQPWLPWDGAPGGPRRVLEVGKRRGGGASKGSREELARRARAHGGSWATAARWSRSQHQH